MPTFEEVIPSRTREFFTRLKDIPFNPGATEGDSGNAWFCAEASALAYKDAAFIDAYSKEKLAPLGWTATSHEVDSTHAVALLSSDAAVLAFRGTRVSLNLLTEAPINLWDLLTDFSVGFFKTEEHGQIHSGFYNAFRNFWNTRGDIIRSQIGTRSLHLTGHSLGGALATVAARLVNLGPQNPASLYTFGSPTVGDEVFREGFETLGLPVFRFVHGYDLVTTVAPPEMRYTHVGDIIHIDENGSGTLSRRKQHTLLKSLRYNVKGVPKGIIKMVKQLGSITSSAPLSFQLPKDALVEHAPINYCRKLSNPAPSRRLPPS